MAISLLVSTLYPEYVETLDFDYDEFEAAADVMDENDIRYYRDDEEF